MKNTKRKIKLSLTSKIFLLIFFLFVVGMGLLTATSYLSGVQATNDLAVAEMRRTASLIATIHSLYEKPDWELTRDFVERTLSLYTNSEKRDFIELLYIYIKDSSGVLRVRKINYDIARKYGIKLSDGMGEPDAKNIFNDIPTTTPYEKELVPHLDRVVMPVVVNGRSRGTIELGYLVTGLATKERQSLFRTLTVFAFLSMIGGFIEIVMIRYNMLPIQNTINAMKDVTHGRFEVEVPETGRAEIKLLTVGFNTMVSEIRRNSIEIKQKSEEVEESVKKYRSLFQMAGDCIILVDDDGICIDANFAAERLFQKPLRQLFNCYVLELVSPLSGTNDFHKLPTRWEGVVNVAGKVGTEVEAHTADLDDNTSIVIFHDITSRKKVERRMNMVRQTFLIHLESFPLGILFIDSNLQLVFANQMVREMFNCEKDRLIADWAEIKSRFVDMDIETAVATVFRKKQDMFFEAVSVEKHDGSRIETEIRINLFTEAPDTPPQVMIIINNG